MPNKPSAVERPLAFEFEGLIFRLAQLMAKEGLRIAARRSGELHFLSLDARAQAQVVTALGRYVSLCEEVLAAGESLRDDVQMLWRMFRRLGLRPPSDLLGHIENNDLIEIYDHCNLQVFRNFVFYSVCSYSLDEVFCRPWFELFRREGAVTESLQGIIAKVMTPPGRLVMVDMPEHTLQELDGERRYRAVVRNRIIAPLWDDENLASAYVGVTKVLSYESTVLDCERRLPAWGSLKPVPLQLD